MPAKKVLPVEWERAHDELDREVAYILEHGE